MDFNKSIIIDARIYVIKSSMLFDSSSNHTYILIKKKNLIYSECIINEFNFTEHRSLYRLLLCHRKLNNLQKIMYTI